MATRSVVPRADNEGSIGVALKKWASGFYTALTSGALTITAFNSAGVVKNTAGGALSGGNSIADNELSSAAQSAISVKHTSGTDQGLDTGGGNAVVVADVKDAVTKKHAGSHAGTSGQIAKFSGTNTLADSAFTEVEMVTRHLRCVVVSPNGLPTLLLCLVPVLPSAITITRVDVTCDADPTTEITGDVKYADTFIGLASPVVINAFNTTAGVCAATSISSAAVAAGKCVYLSFNTAPEAALKQITFDITYTID